MNSSIALSNRLGQVPASPIRKLVPFATAAKKSGVTVHHLNIGDPDIETPEVMVEALRQWNRTPIGYDQSQGNPEFLEALASYYQGLGYSYIGTPNIQVTLGGSEAIAMALFAVANHGDEVLVFEPLYANYNSFAVTTGVTLVPVPTEIGNGFHLPDRRTIESRITARTRAILICNPNNPTGTVYTRDEMDMLVGIARDRNLFLLSDEVYREYCYGGTEHVSILGYMDELPDRTVLLDSVSKRYSLCGARLGAVVSRNTELMAGVLRIGQGRLSCGLVDQVVASKLTEVPKSYIDGVRAEYRKRRDLVYRGLRSIPGVTVPEPEGAFYMIVGLPVPDAEEFCKWLLTDFRLKNETVMLAPAAGFYATPGQGTNEVRIAYVVNTDKLARSIAILKAALSAYPRK